MDLTSLARTIDQMLGFSSQWTYDSGKGCFCQANSINVDIDELLGILNQAGLPQTDVERLAIFVMGHEKGHAMQFRLTPSRDYSAETRVMEIEADLVGAWVVYKRCGSLPPGLPGATKHFTDLEKMAQPLGGAIGNPAGNKSSEYPWAVQRELAFVRGATVATLYTESDVQRDLKTFANDIKDVAGAHEFTP